MCVCGVVWCGVVWCGVVCVCVCVCVCVFPYTGKASTDLNKINVIPEIRSMMLSSGNYYVSSAFVPVL